MPWRSRRRSAGGRSGARAAGRGGWRGPPAPPADAAAEPAREPARCWPYFAAERIAGQTQTRAPPASLGGTQPHQEEDAEDEIPRPRERRARGQRAAQPEAHQQEEEAQLPGRREAEEEPVGPTGHAPAQVGDREEEYEQADGREVERVPVAREAGRGAQRSCRREK